MSHYEHLNDLAAKSEHKGGNCRNIPEDCTCLNNGDFCEACERDAVLGAYYETEPIDTPQVDPVRRLMEKFTEDLMLLSAKMKALGRPQ